MPIKEKKIAYQEDWQKQHWQSLISAYRNSPYFLYYEDELSHMFSRKPTYLIDFLEPALLFLAEKLSIQMNWEYTETYLDIESTDTRDMRKVFGTRPENYPSWFKPIPYTQVFEGFTAGLSCLDLLFNMGPESLGIIKKGRSNLQ